MPRNHEFIVAGQQNSPQLDIVPTNPVLRADPVILPPIGSSTPKVGGLDLNNNETDKAAKQARKVAKYTRRLQKARRAQNKETKARTSAKASRSKKFRTVTLKTVNYAKHRQSFIEPESPTLDPENARLDVSQPGQQDAVVG